MREKPTEQFLLDKQQNIWREKPSLGQDLVQLRANLEVLVRFCNTHRLDNGSGYKVWYKENGLEIPAKPPTVKDRFYDFLNFYCQEALTYDFPTGLDVDFHYPSSNTIMESDSFLPRYSDYDSWFGSAFYDYFMTEIYDLFLSYVMDLINDPDSWPNLWQSAKMWFEYDIVDHLQMPSITAKLLGLSTMFPRLDPETITRDKGKGKTREEEMAGWNVGPVLNLIRTEFGINVASLLPDLCRGLFSAILLQQREARKSPDERLPIFGICQAEKSPATINTRVSCDQLFITQRTGNGHPKWHCTDSCRRRCAEQRKRERELKYDQRRIANLKKMEERERQERAKKAKKTFISPF